MAGSCLVESILQCSEGTEQTACLGMRCHKKINQVLDKICYESGASLSAFLSEVMLIKMKTKTDTRIGG